MEDLDQGPVRSQWGKQIEFVLTMIGYAVGLGNVWRFPYLCFKNGGGAFLIPYTLSLIFLGIPLFALECAFGQYGGKGPLSIWSINPTFKGLGVSMVVASVFVFIYYDVIIAWGLRFLVASFTSDLPWIKCHDCSCLLYDAKNLTEEIVEGLKYNNSIGQNCTDLSLNSTADSPSELYYYKEILHDSGSIEESGDVLWPLLLCNLFAFLVIFLVLLKGIETLGKVVYFTATFPYVLLTILLIRCAMLDGAYDGVLYYLTPKWDRLSDATAWSDAAVQIFFSLSCCMGGLVAMSSYNKFNNNIIRDAFVVPIVNCMTSFYAGFVVFSTLGYMAKIKGVPIEKVTAGGPGLAFIVYPEAIGSMPVSTLWAILFFFMLCILGFSTQFSAAETIMTSIIDEFPKFFNTRKRQTIFRIAVCMMGFILGIPMVTQGGSHLLNLVDEAVLGFPLLLIGLFEYIVIIYLYGFNKFSQDINAMLGRNPFIYFKATWIVISPVLLLAVVVFKAYQMEDFHPGWVGLLYYLIVVFTMMWVPILYFHYSLKHGLWDIMKPKQSWINRRKLSELNKEDKTSEVNDKNTLFINEAPGDKDKLSYVNTAFDDDISKPHDLKDAEMGNGNVTGNGSLAKSADDRKDSANEYSRL
ncbi:sodium- and chloride-dependent glycine transporter 2-like isoform X1 [Biomphalaria glabrata]|uniref:Transporter n=1 Tax=Biomphalaria glabrata TaxID=6526 RepID=A0A9W2Z4K9_BIOGL|nr:sodium- and chloride-dependent glycine transporter 2-like isoform X1 [Biomphalaria glabrata]XP_055869853.1 sodium- and chloride-dependent glycine transporter 2-like isoform X1 [Biomphalaria glabrata]